MSGSREWNQLKHANDWVLLEENMGEHLSIDESMHAKDLFTFLSNKEGHGKKGTLYSSCPRHESLGSCCDIDENISPKI